MKGARPAHPRWNNVKMCVIAMQQRKRCVVLNIMCDRCVDDHRNDVCKTSFPKHNGAHARQLVGGIGDPDYLINLFKQAVPAKKESKQATGRATD